MDPISTYSSTGEKSSRINDRMTAAFIRFEDEHKGVGRGLLGLVQVIIGVVYPIFKFAGAILPLPIAQKYRWIWAKEAKGGLSYIGHGLANMGVGLASCIPFVNADRFGHIKYANEKRIKRDLAADQDRMYKTYEVTPEGEEEQYQYLLGADGKLPESLRPEDL